MSCQAALLYRLVSTRLSSPLPCSLLLLSISVVSQEGQHTCVNKDLTDHANVSLRAAISLPRPVKYVLETFVCGSNPPSMKSMKTSHNLCSPVAMHARTAPMAISESFPVGMYSCTSSNKLKPKIPRYAKALSHATLKAYISGMI